MTDGKKPGAAFWTTVVVVCVPLLYVLSFGPACWWFPRTHRRVDGPPYKVAPKIYWPFGWLLANGPPPICRAVGWYARLGREDIYLTTSSAGGQQISARYVNPAWDDEQPAWDDEQDE